MPARTLSRRTALVIGFLSLTVVATTMALLTTAPSQSPGRTTATPDAPVVDLVDADATAATRALFHRLERQQGRGVLFGHQHDLTHGFTFTEVTGTNSDTLAAVGDYPAVFGWDTLILDGQERPGSPENSPQQNVEALTWAIEQADARGGLNTLSAHLPNIVTGGDFYDTSGDVVRRILPGGDRHAEYTAILDRVADAVGRATRAEGTAIPVIFRPFHENNGGWFWWGAGHTSAGEFVEIFRFTVEYLRDVRDVHNLLYAYSPNTVGGDREAYLATYPGDEFVDVLGYDAYDDGAASGEWRRTVVQDLAMVAELADERGKVPALTEFGPAVDDLADPAWFTRLLSAIDSDPLARRTTYMLTWANFGGAGRVYVPHPAVDSRAAHPLLADFRAFHDDPRSVFAAELTGAADARTRAAPHEPVVHLVTPTDRARVSTAETTVRVSAREASAVVYRVDDGPPQPLSRAENGLWTGTWEIEDELRADRLVTVTIRAEVGGSELTDTAHVLVADAEPPAPGTVDDFESYAGDDGMLAEAYGHQGDPNTLALSTDRRSGGEFGLAYTYRFDALSFTGVSRRLDADWRGFSELRMWLAGDGSQNTGTVQLIAGGVAFEQEFSLADTTGSDVVLPFAGFSPAPGESEHADAALDADRLGTVTAMTIFVFRGGDQQPANGTIHLDDVRAR